MKKVVETVRDVTYLDQIDNYSIVGIDFETDSKSFVVDISPVHPDFKQARFVALSLDDRCIYDKWSKESVKEYVEEVMSMNGNNVVYIFDNHRELAKWLAV